jgi:hypothetical protein
MLVSDIRASLREYGISHDSRGSNHATSQGLIPFDLSDPEVRRRIKRAEVRQWAAATLNLPGGLPDLLYAMVSPAHSEWTPKGMFMWSWRELSWPIIGIFFWWLAGRSIEALLSGGQKIPRPRIRWWEVVVSLPVMAYGGIWAVMFSLDRGSRADFGMWPLLVVFGGMWFVLGACTAAAWIVQWRLRKRFASGGVQQAVPHASGT